MKKVPMKSAFTLIVAGGFMGVATMFQPAEAVLLVYEGFDYPAGPFVDGLNGGIGWDDGWQSINAGLPTETIVATSLVSPVLNVPTTGGALRVAGSGDRFFRNLDGQNFGADGTTIYMSFLQRQIGTNAPNAAIELSRNNQTVQTLVTFGSDTFGTPNFGANDKSAPDNDIVVGTPGSALAPDTNTHFWVVQIDFGAGDDTVSLTYDDVFIGSAVMGNLAFQEFGALFFSGTAGMEMDEIRIGTTIADVVAEPPLPPPDLKVVDLAGIAGGAALELSWLSESGKVYDVQRSVDLVVVNPPPVGTPIQFAFGSRVGPLYTEGTNGPAHQEGSLTALDNKWNAYGTNLSSTLAVNDPMGTLVNTRGEPLPGVVSDFGSSTNGLIDWALQPRQSGSVGGGAEFNNELYQNNFFTDGRNGGPLYIGVNVKGLAAGTYEVYALVREPAALTRTYDSSIGVVTAADPADGIAFGDPGLTTSVGTAAAANGTLDLNSEYFLTTVTVTNSTDAVVVITRPTDNEFGLLNGLQILVPQPPVMAPNNWTNIVTDLSAMPPTNIFAGSYTPAAGVEFYRVVKRDAPPPPAIYFDDFETDSGWTATNIVDNATSWERGTPALTNAQITLISAFSPTNCWGTNLDGNYSASQVLALRSPPINLTGVNSAELAFRQVIDAEGFADAGWRDYGVVNVLDPADLDGTPLVTELLSKQGGTSTGWTEIIRPLPAAALNRSIVLEFRFTADDFFSSWGGWYIDDVEIR